MRVGGEGRMGRTWQTAAAKKMALSMDRKGKQMDEQTGAFAALGFGQCLLQLQAEERVHKPALRHAESGLVQASEMRLLLREPLRLCQLLTNCSCCLRTVQITSHSNLT
jgi:hypothetical protein